MISNVVKIFRAQGGILSNSPHEISQRLDFAKREQYVFPFWNLGTLKKF